MKKLLSLFLLLAFMFSSGQQVNYYDEQPAIVTYTGLVIKVKDGDTITVLDSLNQKHAVRFAGCDAPELKQDFGKAAKNYVISKILNTTIRVKVISRDMYKRDVAWIFYNIVQGEKVYELSGELIGWGYAWQFMNTNSSLQLMEQYAKEYQRNLFSNPNAIRPNLFRKNTRYRPLANPN